MKREPKIVKRADGTSDVVFAETPPVSPDAVWDDDNTAPQPVQPHPAMEWKPIAETMDELNALGKANILIYALADGRMNVESARWAYSYAEPHGFTHWMPAPPTPKPTPTVAELERAVVEAAVRVEYHLDSGLTHAVIALRRARENAAKGGGNQRGDAAGVK